MKTKTFTAELIETIISRLNDYKGTSNYMCDLSSMLFVNENIDGSVLYNAYQTKEFIKENFYLFGDLVEYVKDNMNYTLNPFQEPEKAHVWLLLEASQSILSKLPTIDKFWNDEKELTPKLIKQLTKELNALNIDDEDLF